MTALPSLAELDQLSERLGVQLDPQAADGLRAQSALDDASALIRDEGLPWETIADVPALVQTITLAVAFRSYKNPDGVTQASVGDVAISYAGAGHGTAVFLTPAELRAIRKAAGKTGISTIELESGDMADRDPYWVKVDRGGDDFPLGPLPWRS